MAKSSNKTKQTGVTLAAMQVTLCLPWISAYFVKKNEPIAKDTKLIEPSNPIL